MKYNVIEIFTSINGEGIRGGELSTFVRFVGCNLRCRYCDSAYTYDPKEGFQIMDEDEIVDYCKKAGAHNLTLAGGEPLYQKGIKELIARLVKEGFSVEIETNGSIDIKEISEMEYRPHFTLDYKTSASGMEKHNKIENYQYLHEGDAVKFVVGSKKDLEKMVDVVERNKLLEKCKVLVSPVFGEIEPVEIVDFMKENNLNGYKMQMQIHKFIWSPDERGV